MAKSESNAAPSAAAQQMPINPNLILILIILQFFFSGYLFFKVNSMTSTGTAQAAVPTDATAPEVPTDTSKMPEVTETDHIKGSRDAQVVMVEYSDFECPFCKTFHSTLNEIMTDPDIGDKVSLVYRHYPLSFHPKAQKSAEASECVAELGGEEAFWAFHDEVFAQMPELELSGLANVAAQVGVDAAAFQSCLDSDKYAQKVKTDMDGGSAAGVQGTPGLVLVGKNGKRDFVGGAYPASDVKTKIQALLQ